MWGRYNEFIQVLVDLGHVEKVPSAERYYLPHRNKIKEVSTTTNFRVVF